MYCHEASTCGSVGLKAIRSLAAKRPSATQFSRFWVKRECPADPDHKCPAWNEYTRGTASRVKEKAMPVWQAWNEHMELRAVVGHLATGNNKVAFQVDDSDIFKWQETKMWEGQQEWPRDAFVAALYDFYAQPRGFEPPQKSLLLGRASTGSPTSTS